jgi:DNA-3-methyladenine glycosylase
MRGVPLPRSFYQRPVRQVARDLLGRILVRRPGGKGDADGRHPRGREVPQLAGRIVEVEAYDGPRDLACHASKGRTARTDPMFGEAGHAYVYLIYGIHCCLNVVTGPVGYPAAVLIRALEPVEGFGGAGGTGKASGPGRLCRAFRIDRGLNRADLCLPGSLFIEAGEPVGRGRIVRGPRIGVDYAGAWAARPWRFGVRGSGALSRPFQERM